MSSLFDITTKPMRHQEEALTKLRFKKVGALFMDMGTGKTLTALMIANNKKSTISKIIWCCPVSLKEETKKQVVKHTSLNESDVFLFDNSVSSGKIPSHFFYIVGMESIGSSDRVVMAFNELIDDETMLIVDESSLIKGHRSKRTKRITSLGSRSKYRLILNGTPISQGIEDLYSQFEFLSPLILGYKSWYSFSNKHIKYSELYKGVIDKRFGEDEIAKKINAYTYQITKDECLDLPDKSYIEHYVCQTSSQIKASKLAKATFENEVSDLDFDDVGISIYKMFTSLRSISNGVVPKCMVDDFKEIKTNKYSELLDVVGRLGADRFIIWANYTENILNISALLRDNGTINVSQYYGGLNESARAAELLRWRGKGGALVATQGCGGLGLTLTEASYNIFFGNDFKYSSRIQAEDRTHRIGQHSPVTYIDIWTDCGIESRIRAAIQSKGDALESFRDEVSVAHKEGSLKNIHRSLI